MSRDKETLMINIGQIASYLPLFLSFFLSFTSYLGYLDYLVDNRVDYRE